jgi:hypothetical protein
MPFQHVLPESNGAFCDFPSSQGVLPQPGVLAAVQRGCKEQHQQPWNCSSLSSQALGSSESLVSSAGRWTRVATGQHCLCSLSIWIARLLKGAVCPCNTGDMNSPPLSAPEEPAAAVTHDDKAFVFGGTMRAGDRARLDVQVGRHCCSGRPSPAAIAVLLKFAAIHSHLQQYQPAACLVQVSGAASTSGDVSAAESGNGAVDAGWRVLGPNGVSAEDRQAADLNGGHHIPMSPGTAGLQGLSLEDEEGDDDGPNPYENPYDMGGEEIEVRLPSCAADWQLGLLWQVTEVATGNHLGRSAHIHSAGPAIMEFCVIKHQAWLLSCLPGLPG